MEIKLLKDIKKNELFTLKPLEEPKANQIYIKNFYDRTSKKYSCSKWSDFCDDKLIKGDKVVYVGLIF